MAKLKTDEEVIAKLHQIYQTADRARKKTSSERIRTDSRSLREEEVRLEGEMAGIQKAISMVEEKRNENLFPF